MNWFQGLYEDRERFHSLEEESAYRENQRSFARPEVKDLNGLLRLSQGSRILDAFCGNGKHAMEFARCGFEVTGVDLSASRIRFAHNWARAEAANARFLVCDARALAFRRLFDAVVVLGGSFTYSREAEENVALLKGLKAVLRAGGKLLLDNPNPLRFWRLQHPEAPQADQRAVRYFDLPLGKGNASGWVRYYGVREMMKLFDGAGLLFTKVLGDRKGGAYAPESPRMIVIGRAEKA